MKKWVTVGKLHYRSHRDNQNVWLKTLVMLRKLQVLFSIFLRLRRGSNRAEPDDNVLRMRRLRLVLPMRGFDSCSHGYLLARRQDCDGQDRAKQSRINPTLAQKSTPIIKLT